jgi:hypothetical protein
MRDSFQGFEPFRRAASALALTAQVEEEQHDGESDDYCSD